VIYLLSFLWRLTLDSSHSNIVVISVMNRESSLAIQCSEVPVNYDALCNLGSYEMKMRCLAIVQNRILEGSFILAVTGGL